MRRDKELEKYEKDELEMELFKELDYLNNKPETEKIVELNRGEFGDWLETYFRYDTTIAEVVEITEDGKTILANGSDFYIYKKKLDLGTKTLISDDGIKEIVDWDELLENFKQLTNNNSRYRTNIDELDNISFKVLKEREEKGKKAQEEEAKRELEEKRIEEEKKEDVEGIFKETGKYKGDNLEIDGKTLKRSGTSWDLHKGTWKDKFSWREMVPYSYWNSISYRNLLIDKEISFTEWEDVPAGKKLKIKITFGGKGNNKMNGVKVAKAKINFIINRLWDQDKLHDKELIQRYNKLSGMKSDLIDLKKINLHYGSSYYGSDGIQIPLSINLTDYEDTFEISIFGKTKELSWNDCKKMFFNGGSSRSLYSTFRPNEIFNFAKTMGIETKQEVLDFLKRCKMLQDLENENDDE